MNRYTFEVLGTPQPKGSTRAFVVKGRPVVTSDNPKARSWAKTVRRLQKQGPTIGAGPSSLRQAAGLATRIFGPRYTFTAINTELRRVVGATHLMERSDATGPGTKPRRCALRQGYGHSEPSLTAFTLLLDSILAAGSTTELAARAMGWPADLERLPATLAYERGQEVGLPSPIDQENNARIGAAMKDASEGLDDLAVIFPDEASACVVTSLEEIVHICPLMCAPKEKSPEAENVFRYLIARPAPAILQRPGQLVSIAAIAGGHVCSGGYHAWPGCWQWIALQANEVKLVLARYGIGPCADISKINHARWQLIHISIIAHADAMTGIVYRDDAQVVGLEARKQYGERPGLTCEIRWPADGRETMDDPEGTGR